MDTKSPVLKFKKITLDYSLSKFIFENYGWLISINAVCGLLWGNNLLMTILFPLSVYVLAIRTKKRADYNVVDILFISNLIWIILTWLFNSFPHKLEIILYTFLSQIAFMMAFFIGRDSKLISLNNIINKSFIPISICCLLGIWWFFSPPDFILYNALDTESSNFIEKMRLRSVFPSPYHLAFFCSLSLSISLFLFFQKKLMLSSVKYKCLFLLYSITLLLCMMRGPILCAIFSVTVLIFQVSFNKKNGRKIIVKYIVFSILVISVFLLLISNFNDALYNAFIGKYEAASNTGDFLGERIGMYDNSFNFWGDGVGRYSLFVYNLGMPSIADSEYVKILCEQGVFGFILFILLVFCVFFKTIKYFRYLSLDFCIIVFYLVTMIGANSLSTVDKHSFIFWFTIGRISSFKSPINKMKNSIESFY